MCVLMLLSNPALPVLLLCLKGSARPSNVARAHGEGEGRLVRRPRILAAPHQLVVLHPLRQLWEDTCGSPLYRQ